MLAEKFLLLLETLKSQSLNHRDGSPVVVSTARHVPVHLPSATGK